jgi:RNA polymerase sigma-70 factor (ECF subfamily)
MAAGPRVTVSAVFRSSPLGEPTPPHPSGATVQGRAIDEHILVLVGEDRAAAALDVLYRTYKDRIYTFLLRMSGAAELADDLTQDTFLKADRALRSLEAGRTLLPWLYRIASNAAIDELRRRRRFAWLRWPSLRGTVDEPHAPDEHARVPERQRIAHAMRAIPPENAAALLLHAVEGYSYREIAEIQGCSLTAVRSRIARARGAFRGVYDRADAAELGRQPGASAETPGE